MTQRVLSGIRATGRLHLGNYLGAVKGMLALQADPQFETLYMVADAHTLTTPYNINQLKTNRQEVILDYLAAGLNPDQSTIFFQSDVPAHFELSCYLASVISIARLQHLPTFKEKVKQYPHHATMALLNYPILMAADILVYKASQVPVGIDQEPHLEVAREIARKMNDLYGTDFPEPVRFATPGEYVPSLSGTGKMSKSIAGSFINLTDDLTLIKKRLAAAPTDTGKGKNIPQSGGVANLLNIVELFEGKEKKIYYEQLYLSSGIKYGQLKNDLAEAIFKELQPIQTKRHQLTSQPESVDQVIQAGAAKASLIAQQTLKEVKAKMGLA